MIARARYARLPGPAGGSRRIGFEVSFSVAAAALRATGGRALARPNPPHPSNRQKPAARSASRASVAVPLATLSAESRAFTALWFVAAALALWSCGFTIMKGSDLWWHLANGHWILDHHAIPLTDSWSYTMAGKPWINDEWLAGLQLAAWQRAFGLESLVWWKWAMLVGTWLLLFHTVRRTSGSALAAFVAVVFGAMVAAPFLDIRPQLYSFLGYAVVLHLCFGRTRPSWALPAVFLVWANLHAVVLFGLVALALLLAPAVIRGPAAERHRAILIGLACCAAILVNPLGIAVATRPLDYALHPESPYRTLGEWLPPFLMGDWPPRLDPAGIRSALYVPAMVGFVLAAIVAAITRTWRRNPALFVTGLVLGAITLAMSFSSRRFIPLFAMSQALLLGNVLACVVPPPPRLARAALPVAALILGIVLLWPYPRQSYAFHYLTDEDTFPVEIVDFLVANRISGPVFSYYNWGGYLHLRTQGAMRVYIDGRGDMVYDKISFGRYVGALRREQGWQEFIEGSGARFVLWPRVQPDFIRDLLATGRWKFLYQDAVGALLVHADEPPAPSLLVTGDSPWKELALGSLAASQNQLASAEAHYRRAIGKMPHLQLANYALVEVEVRQGRYEDALRQIAVCQRIFPNAERRKRFEAMVARVRAGG